MCIYFLACQNQWSEKDFLSQELFTLQPVHIFLQQMENVHSESDGVEGEIHISLETLVICLFFKIPSFSTMSLLPLLAEVTKIFTTGHSGITVKQ